MTPSCVSVHHMFTLRLSTSCSKCSSGGLTASNDTVLPTDTYRDVIFCLISEDNVT
jgi:hypothetical protein